MVNRAGGVVKVSRIFGAKVAASARKELIKVKSVKILHDIPSCSN